MAASSIGQNIHCQSLFQYEMSLSFAMTDYENHHHFIKTLVDVQGLLAQAACLASTPKMIAIAE
ncbi:MULTISPECIES: hypothetical protein [Gammaproteobacteria]|uniref:hypothetical protein n=1 Tax=Gammaproteobacteria TaxID=1236 RepID=UPI001AD9E06A|nr:MULTISPECIES: hypothetical protein [Gammaproteobacteria]MBO9483230.1 hypothetical protein [Salinisphaera sp. G21_0]MBO9494034.1 hypothetical protein [Thalassotalea sp. G20_0]